MTAVNTIIHADCLNALPELPAKSINFVLTDPPYIARYKSRDGRKVLNDDNDAWLKPAFAEMFEKLEQYAPWFRIVLSCCIVGVLRAPNRCEIPTLFMLDEYAATVGRLAMLEQSIPYIEGMGGRYAFIFQTLSQMQKLWPEPEYHGIFASAGAHVFFNVNDKNTSEYVASYVGKYTAMTPAPGGMSFVQRDLLTPDEVRTLPPTDLIAFIRGYRPAWLGKLDVRHHPEFKGRLLPNPAYRVLPDAPRAIAAPSAPLLDASQAIARAKQTPNLSLQAITAVLEDKYPGKHLRLDGEMCGYDVPWLDPATGMTETVFMPVMHITLLEMLSKGGTLGDANHEHDRR